MGGNKSSWNLVTVALLYATASCFANDRHFYNMIKDSPLWAANGEMVAQQDTFAPINFAGLKLSLKRKGKYLKMNISFKNLNKYNIEHNPNTVNASDSTFFAFKYGILNHLNCKDSIIQFDEVTLKTKSDSAAYYFVDDSAPLRWIEPNKTIRIKFKYNFSNSSLHYYFRKVFYVNYTEAFEVLVDLHDSKPNAIKYKIIKLHP